MMKRCFGGCAALMTLCVYIADHGLAVQKQLDVSFGSSSSQKLDVWWDAKNTNAPIVFLIHGGGWKSGDKRTYSDPFLATMITDLGCVLVSPNYRLMGSDENPTEFDVMQDVWVALAWFREHAGEYGANKNVIITGGSSAGSHLSASLAYGNQREWLASTPYAGQEKEILASVKGWYGDSCAVDMNIKREVSPSSYAPGMRDLFNPIEQIDPGEPPALCINWDSDRITPLEGVFNFQRKMTDLKVQCTVLVIPGGQHMTGTRLIFKSYEKQPDKLSELLSTKETYDAMRQNVLTHLNTFITSVVMP